MTITSAVVRELIKAGTSSFRLMEELTQEQGEANIGRYAVLMKRLVVEVRAKDLAVAKPEVKPNPLETMDGHDGI